MDKFKTATATIKDGIPYCAFCEDKMLLAHEEITPDGHPLQAFMCERCFSSYIQGNPQDRFLQFYERIAQTFFKIWRKSIK